MADDVVHQEAGKPPEWRVTQRMLRRMSTAALFRPSVTW